MAKLQSIERKDGSVIYLTYLPKRAVEAAFLNKGDKLRIECTGEGELTVKKDG